MRFCALKRRKREKRQGKQQIQVFFLYAFVVRVGHSFFAFPVAGRLSSLSRLLWHEDSHKMSLS
jgi:hypothetical protein